MYQKFYASQTDTFTSANGAIGHRSGGPMDGLGPYAKVRNCPVVVGGKTVARLTCYASAYADTWYSVPAVTRRKGRHVAGFFTCIDNDGGTVFRPYTRFEHLFV